MISLLFTFLPFAFGIFLYFIANGSITLGKKRWFKNDIIKAVLYVASLLIILKFGIKLLFALANYFT